MPSLPERVGSVLRERGKLAHALRRRWFWLGMRGVRVHAVELEQLGTEYGAWHVPVGLIRPGWTAWCVGAGHDTSFEQALLQRHDMAEVRSFDPYELYRDVAAPKVDADPRWTFHAVAIATADGPLEMFGRQDDERGAVSADPSLHRGERFVREGRTLASLMDETGTAAIELLKIDVEGLEYELVPGLDLRAMGVVQVSLELHENGGPRAGRRILAGLGAQGYRVVGRRGTGQFNLVRADALAALRDDG